MYLFQAVVRFDHHKLANHKVCHFSAKYTWKIWMENRKSAMRIFKWVLELLCTHCTAENCIHRLFLFFNLFQTRWNEIFVKKYGGAFFVFISCRPWWLYFAHPKSVGSLSSVANFILFIAKEKMLLWKPDSIHNIHTSQILTNRYFWP